jgi:hypothetical protein
METVILHEKFIIRKQVGAGPIGSDSTQAVLIHLLSAMSKKKMRETQ